MLLHRTRVHLHWSFVASKRLTIGSQVPNVTGPAFHLSSANKNVQKLIERRARPLIRGSTHQRLKHGSIKTLPTDDKAQQEVCSLVLLRHTRVIARIIYLEENTLLCCSLKRKQGTRRFFPSAGSTRVAVTSSPSDLVSLSPSGEFGPSIPRSIPWSVQPCHVGQRPCRSQRCFLPYRMTEMASLIPQAESLTACSPLCCKNTAFERIRALQPPTLVPHCGRARIRKRDLDTNPQPGL